MEQSTRYSVIKILADYENRTTRQLHEGQTAIQERSMEYNSNFDSPDRVTSPNKPPTKPVTKILSPSKSLKPQAFGLQLQSKMSMGVKKPGTSVGRDGSSLNRRQSS
jgi:hypothetical protein